VKRFFFTTKEISNIYKC